MKKNTFLLSVCLVLISSQLIIGQSTSFETDFSDPGGANGTWAFIDESTGEFTKEISNGELKITYDKTSWHFIQLWVNPFNLSQSPYLLFTAKADKSTTLYITVKDLNDNTFSLTADLTTAYQLFYFNLTDDMSALNSNIKELQFDVGYGAFDGILYFDDFKMGDAAQPDIVPPTIDPVDNLLVYKGFGEQSVTITGITDGGDGGQTIDVSVETNNSTLVTDLNVAYTSPEDTAVLTFIPATDTLGTATITITLTDDGEFENTTTMQFDVVIAEFGGTGFTDDFEDVSIDPDWDLQNNMYSLEQSSGTLIVYPDKKEGFQSFYRQLPGIFDLSDYPYVNLSVKGESSFVLWVYLVDIDGNNAYKQVRVMKSDYYVKAFFDFSDKTNINLKQINKILFAFNPYALTFSSTVWFEELLIGSDAQQMAFMTGVDNKEYYINSGTKSILLTDIQKAESVLADGGSNLVSNISFTPIEDGMSTMTFDLREDSTGTETIILTVNGESTYLDNYVLFDITVSDNHTPKIDPIPDQVVVKDQEITLKLSGISDGDASIEQDLTILALSDNETIVANPIEIEFEQGSPYAYLSFIPLDTGQVTITIDVDDGGGGNDSVYTDFTITVYNELNHTPTLDPLEKQAVFNNAGEQSVTLTGITDGDDGSQNLIIRASSSIDSIIPNPLAVEYTEGNTAILKYTPNPSNTGTCIISITVIDDGGNAQNNGNDSITISFEVDTRIPPLTGYVYPFEGNPYSIFGVEGTQFALELVDSGDFNAIRIDMTDKWDWGGMWLTLPFELDLTDHPYISYEVFSVDNITYHWNYFYDVEGERNIQNSTSHMLPVSAVNEWTTITFDYRDEGDLNTNEGEMITIDRITNVLFNLHHQPGGWPNTFYTGTVYYRNLRIGDEVDIAPKQPVATIDPLPEIVNFVNEDQQNLILTGISDGTGETEGVNVTATSNLPDIIPDPSIGTLQPDGSLVLSYVVGETVGVARITVTVSSEGSLNKVITFDINVVTNDVMETATLTVDRSKTYQTILGMGTFQNEKRWVDLYVNDMGASAVRMGLISNQIEPENDNDDPYVLNREGLNYDAFDFEYVRMLKEAGVETFILTSWSPPAWMKHNLSEDYRAASASHSTINSINRLEFHYYEEFAESMVAVVKMFEEEAGIHLEAIGLQNEPAFNEPYASAILDSEYFPELIKVVGKRFEQEGITTRLFMPEEVYAQTTSLTAYIDSFLTDEEAQSYCDIIAVHGYASDGINPGFPNYSGWTNLYNRIQEGIGPKELWMSETFIAGGSFTAALNLAGAIHGALWGGNVSLWTNWSFGTMQMVRNEPTGSFYASKNFFRFIRPGAVRLNSGSNNADVMITAFEHPEDNTMTLVVINKSSNAKTAKLFGSNLPEGFKAFRTTNFENCVEVDSIFTDIFILPPKSVTTFISESFPLLKMDAIQDQHLEMNDPEQQITITGIDDGMGGTASLTISAETDNPTLITGLNISTVQPDGTADLSYTPGSDQIGSGKITITLSDGTNTKEMSFYVIVLDYTGILEKKQNELKVYPNPVDEMLYIEIPDLSYDDLVVYDISGRVVGKVQLNSERTVTLGTNQFEPGTYIVTVGNRQERIRTVFVVK